MIQRQFPPTERNIPTNSEQHSDQWEPEIIVEQAPLLNGGPPTLWSECGTIPEITTTVTTTPVTTTRIMPIESVSISSTLQVSSTGMEERIPTTRPICLPEEDPQIPCPVCDVIDCMIHNPRHQYCINCGQRLLGPHTCPNEREHPEPPIVQYPIPIGVTRTTGPESRIEISERRACLPGNPFLLSEDTDVESLREMVLSSTHMLNMDLVTRPIPPIPPPTAPPRPTLAKLPTYDEAITSDQGITA